MSPFSVLMLFLVCSGTLGALLGRRLKTRRNHEKAATRFSLRSLLVVMTVVALLLGSWPLFSKWMQRRQAIQQVRWAFANLRETSMPIDLRVVRHQEKAWIISTRPSRFVEGGISLGEPPWQSSGPDFLLKKPTLNENKGKLWVSPPGQWVTTADEALRLIEPEL